MQDKKEKLAQLFLRFPGIGRRQAERFAYHILNSDQNYINKLISAISDSRQNIRLCNVSYQFFQTDNPNQMQSPIVLDPMRDKSILMIVEKDLDLDNIERTGIYNGQYFVLGGNLSVRPSKNNPENIRLDKLINHLKDKQDIIREVIIALSLNPDGEYTTGYLHETIAKEFPNKFILSELGRGLSTGLEMEYVDSSTLENALSRRVSI